MTRNENKPSIAAVKDLMGTIHDALRTIVQDLLQEMLEGEMTDALGASKSERAGSRSGYRSGHYNRTLITQAAAPPAALPNDGGGLSPLRETTCKSDSDRDSGQGEARST